MKNTTLVQSNAVRWARFRFSIIGPLLAAPPGTGQLKSALATLANKQWQHPIHGQMIQVSVSTLERWFYAARKADDPVQILKTKRRQDAGQSYLLSTALKQRIREQYQAHPGWSYQLHLDNLAVLVKQQPELGLLPSYSTLCRFMKTAGLTKKRRCRKRHTLGAQQADERLQTREVRRFEMEHVSSLWHLDFHHSSRKLVDSTGQWRKPMLLAIMDDYSRLICHAQWYWDESTESLVHGFKQALQKRGLPRAVMSDNGAAMTSAEFTQGLARLSILHQPTLPYSPYQNAKQEVFWAQVESRLMAMLEGESSLTLSLMNEALIAWVEFDYHRKRHSEIGVPPLERYAHGDDVRRVCPSSLTLSQMFCTQVKRRQRQSDGTFTLEGCRFEVPAQYRSITELTVRYARWDMRQAWLIDPHSESILAMLHPEDKQANNHGYRRIISSQDEKLPANFNDTGMAPLLKKLMADYAATGLPAAYLPKGELA